MGKVRRQRKKFHLPANQTKPTTFGLEKPIETETASGPEFLIAPQENLFANLNIDVGNLNKSLPDDVRSVKSFKSVKSESEKIISKKGKLKLRRELLMKKFEAIKEEKQLVKKKKAVGGDLNPLRDALPSLESLLKSKGNVPYKQKPQKKRRGIEKAKTIKKNQLQGIQVFQQMFKSKQFQKDPQVAIAQQIKAVLENDKSS
ncbi:hypothetical protein Zmor_008554 [Zophobas morio]|uniref:Ribosome biogenesis protein SLX9 n=1 Tax=Zophobas morio TaxID=2755281 RepID=A0AA38J364_9CUCU|nr:hypothetical protein Zmor_008554 [Zophobas morio]